MALRVRSGEEWEVPAGIPFGRTQGKSALQSQRLWGDGEGLVVLLAGVSRR